MVDTKTTNSTLRMESLDTRRNRNRCTLVLIVERRRSGIGIGIGRRVTAIKVYVVDLNW